MRAFQQRGKVTEHDRGRGQGFAGSGQQGFGIGFGIDEEHLVGGVWRGDDAGTGIEVVVEDAVGGSVEFSGVDGGVGGCWVRHYQW